MTADQRFEQDLPALLADLAMPSVPSYRDEVVRQVEATPQRPAWTFPERWIPMDTAMRRLPVAQVNWRLVALAALLLLAGVAIAIVAATANRKAPAPPYGPAVNGLIAFADKGDVYLGDPATGETRQITNGPEVDGGVYFSRDGTKIAIFRETGTPLESDILIANADASGLHKMTDTPLVEVNGADWSGDGRWVVTSSMIDGLPTMTLFDLDSRTSRILNVGMGAEVPYFRPPDGREILFVSSRPNDGTYAVSIDGGTPHRVAFGAGPRYSPDGSQIAFLRMHFVEDSQEIESVTVHVVNADGTGEHEIGQGPGGIWYQNPKEWSPDSSRVLLIRGYHDGTRTFTVVPADASGPGVEYPVPFTGDWGPVGWSPDGRFINFAGDGAAEATLVDTRDGSMRRAPLWYAVDPDGDATSWQRLAP